MMDLGLTGKVAVITGGGGAICGETARTLAALGAKLAILDLSAEAAECIASGIREAGGEAIGVQCDATCRESVEAAADRVIQRFHTVDILINGAGGSRKDCTTSDDLPFFDIAPGSLSGAIALNYSSAVVPSQVFGRIFAERKLGVILNISSIAGLRPLTRAIGYSNGKAAINSFTQWLAVHMADNYSPEIRVNAIAPGFMLTEQNRFLLVDAKTGGMTERGRQVMSSVPMKRYGTPKEIAALAAFLVSDQASFITGAVVPVDGGLSAISGV
jgi:NAD(P)-dependent dehydrogenase (short-subunit alcohol dehydrogenase family)